MTMNALLVYEASKYQLDGQIERLPGQGAIQVISAGEQLLVSGIYRFDNTVTVSNLSGGDAEVVAVPDVKNPWPDPPRLEALMSSSGVTRERLIGFLGGSGEAIEL